MSRSDAWYDDFWDNLNEDEDDRTSATRILGELLADDVVRRDGDLLVGTAYFDLSTNDQYLVRRIEDAARAADS